MSLLSNESQAGAAQLTGTGLAALPRVNLLPPELAERKRFRRIQYGLGGAVVGTVGLVVVGFVLASGSVSSAHTQLEAANTENSRLTAESAKYNSVTQVYAQAAAAQAMLTEAMGQEVRYSRLLSDLSLSVPQNVWLTQLAYAQGSTDKSSTATPAATPAGLGTMTVSGVAFSHDDVAAWLESLGGQKALANPYFSSSAEALMGSRKVVNFTSTASLTQDALSGRYTKPAGG